MPLNILYTKEYLPPRKSVYTPEEIKESERKIKWLVGGVMVLGYVGHWTARLMAEYGVCLNQILPKAIENAVKINNALLGLFTIPVSTALPSALQVPFYNIVAAPIAEEFEARFLFQEVLLRRVPKAILNRCCKKYAPLVESKVAKIARIALSATLFAIMHMGRADDHKNACLGSNYGFIVLGMGAYTGYVTETIGGIGPAILYHMAMNCMASVAGVTELTP